MAERGDTSTPADNAITDNPWRTSETIIKFPNEFSSFTSAKTVRFELVFVKTVPRANY